MAERRTHVIVYFFFAALAGPVSDIAGGRTRSTWFAGVALAAFVACFVLIVENSRHPGGTGPTEPLTPRKQRINRALFAALLVLAVAATLGFGHGWVVLFMFVVAASAFSVSIRWAPAVMALVTVVAVAVELALDRSVNGLASAASWALSIALSGFLALLMRRRALLIQELRAAQGEVARRAAADAVIDERLRFARDLHDLLGHSLSVIVLKAELAGRLLDRGVEPARIRAEVDDLEQIARRALDEVREAVSGYRARSLDAELEQARAALEAAGVAVTVQIARAALPPDIDDLLAWVVREAATNIVRHSRARRAEIAVREVDGAVRLDVCNDGVAGGAAVPAAASPSGANDSSNTASNIAANIAPNDAPGGTGLVGLRERVAEAGGRLTAVAEDRGFRVTAIVPLGVAPPVEPAPDHAAAIPTAALQPAAAPLPEDAP